MNRLGPTSHRYYSQGLRLHYVDWGNEGAPPLLLVHGGNDHCRSWDWLAQRLADRFHVLAVDLRGHGDSDHAPGSHYPTHGFILDLAQLIEQRRLAPVNILAHSWGGAVSLLYAGVYPEKLRRLMVIEGWGPSPAVVEKHASVPTHERLRNWVEATRAIAHKRPPRYAGIEDCIARMKAANARLTDEQARHLTIHAASQNEDGTYSWKYDPYVRVVSPTWHTPEELGALWSRITCPVLLLRGTESWAADPVADGKTRYFRDVRVEALDHAGHWVHHDRLDEVAGMADRFFSQ
ncbi:alpha/beta fold hydrolase [Zavarzinia compransoris]|uniref:Alpha/beta hydrolase n=1 Tax=Zavarzinia compransoris TaxID=1264899 RepID=A0A317E1P4_9PROT|nr:alpha/beta hydrolase [Zavarzinia compransoris]PWR20561.1 alpha/beta hydrolase [Zavarzinia compransoris]TDP43793.1 pimeloyl-ACP methyl ester carboxylesterase [Zavarzinia compransoris]